MGYPLAETWHSWPPEGPDMDPWFIIMTKFICSVLFFFEKTPPAICSLQCGKSDLAGSA